MTERRDLVERITREVLERLRESGAVPAASPEPEPTPPASAFRHPSTRDGDDRALAHDPASRSPEAVRSFVAAGAGRIGAAPGAGRVPADVASTIDHTLLKPDATREQIETLCDEARGSPDYQAIGRNYTTLILRGVPQLTMARRDTLRRFILLIDTLYF